MLVWNDPDFILDDHSGSKYEVGMYVQTLKVKNNVAQLYNWNEYRENIILTLSILPSMFLPSTYGN